jgi:hypothetical protein
MRKEADYTLDITRDTNGKVVRLNAWANDETMSPEKLTMLAAREN